MKLDASIVIHYMHDNHRIARLQKGVRSTFNQIMLLISEHC